jgi:uncharacterized protein
VYFHGGAADTPEMESFLSGVVAGRSMELIEAATGRVLVPRLEIAGDSASRKRGLLGRSHLPDGTGLVIAPTNAIHTFFMRFPIDVVFVARDGRVLKVSRHLPSWRIAVGWGAYAVVELAADAATALGIDVGTALRAQPCESG